MASAAAMVKTPALKASRIVKNCTAVSSAMMLGECCVGHLLMIANMYASCDTTWAESFAVVYFSDVLTLVWWPPHMWTPELLSDQGSVFCCLTGTDLVSRGALVLGC